MHNREWTDEIGAASVGAVPNDPPKDLTRLAINVRRLRQLRGWTLERAAAETGLSLSVISMIERGDRRNPGLETLQGLAAGFGVPIDELVGELVEDMEIPAGLQQLVDSGLAGELTTDEIRSLLRARSAFGRPLTARDYLDLVDILRRAKT